MVDAPIEEVEEGFGRRREGGYQVSDELKKVLWMDAGKMMNALALKDLIIMYALLLGPLFVTRRRREETSVDKTRLSKKVR